MLKRFQDVLSRVQFNKWRFLVKEEQTRVGLGYVTGGCYLQVEAAERCNVTSESIVWKSRKWRLSEHMTDGEIVQTAFLAVLTAMEHEIREQFLYRGTAIFDPHYDIEKLVELRQRSDALIERAAA